MAPGCLWGPKSDVQCVIRALLSWLDLAQRGAAKGGRTMANRVD